MQIRNVVTPSTLASRGALAFIVGLTMLSNASAAPTNLTNGPGDGTLSVGVDGFGSFGSSVSSDTTDALFDPVGAQTPAGTSFQSGVALRFGSSGLRSFLSTGLDANLANPAVVATPTLATSAFTSGPLAFRLSQELIPLFTGLAQTGTELRQNFLITNTGATSTAIELVRYLDGDLVFDGSISDGGGRFLAGSREFLFETDSATGSNAATTFVGITAEGGTIPGTGRYEVDSFADLRARILAGTLLDDTVTGDGADADQFIDAGSGYDVTLALNNQFALAPAQTGTYATSTFFGSGAPGGVIPEPATALTGLMVCGALGFSRRRRIG